MVRAEPQDRSQMIRHISSSQPKPATPHTLPSSTSNQLTLCATGPSAAPQLSTEQLQLNPLISPLSPTPYICLDPSITLQNPQFHWHVVAGAPHGLALASSDMTASVPSPIASAAHCSEHEFGNHPDLTWATFTPLQKTVIPSMSPNYEPLNPNPGVSPNLSQPVGAMRPDERYNRVADRHQRLAASRPYVVPPANPNRTDRTDTPVNCGRAELLTHLPSQTEGLRDLAPRDSGRRLTLDTYEWLFAVMYPKRRPDKRKPTPSGRCQLCESTCKRPGILQQHVTILHRQRLARMHLAGKPYDLQLALAFVVAQMLGGVVINAQMDAAHQESQAFLDILKSNPAGLESLQPGAFPLLHEKLDEFIKFESWVGVQCRNCGMWATRPTALEEHAAVCIGFKWSADSSGLRNIFQEPFRLTASGLAARPYRGRHLNA